MNFTYCLTWLELRTNTNTWEPNYKPYFSYIEAVSTMDNLKTMHRVKDVQLWGSVN